MERKRPQKTYGTKQSFISSNIFEHIIDIIEKSTFFFFLNSRAHNVVKHLKILYSSLYQSYSFAHGNSKCHVFPRFWITDGFFLIQHHPVELLFNYSDCSFSCTEVFGTHTCYCAPSLHNRVRDTLGLFFIF